MQQIQQIVVLLRPQNLKALRYVFNQRLAKQNWKIQTYHKQRIYTF